MEIMFLKIVVTFHSFIIFIVSRSTGACLLKCERRKSNRNSQRHGVNGVSLWVRVCKRWIFVIFFLIFEKNNILFFFCEALHSMQSVAMAIHAIVRLAARAL